MKLCVKSSICKCFGRTGILTADYNVFVGNGVYFFLCGVVIVGFIGEIQFSVVEGNDSMISPPTKCDWVWISYCV